MHSTLVQFRHKNFLVMFSTLTSTPLGTSSLCKVCFVVQLLLSSRIDADVFALDTEGRAKPAVTDALGMRLGSHTISILYVLANISETSCLRPSIHGCVF